MSLKGQNTLLFIYIYPVKKSIKIIDFYIFSNIHVALAAFSFTKLTLLFYKNYENEIPVFIALSTFLAYNFLKIYDLKNNTDEWFKNWIFSYLKLLKILSFLSLLLLFYMIILIKTVILIWLFPLVFLTLLYIIPVFNYKNIPTSLRMYPSFKIFYVVLVWTFATTVIPLISITNFYLSSNFIILFLGRFLLFIALIIPFEIRDINNDSANLKTLPQVVGIYKTKMIGIFLLILSGFLNFLIYSDFIEYLILLLILLISGIVILKSTSSQSKYYSAFWVEGIPILWLFLIELWLCC